LVDIYIGEEYYFKKLSEAKDCALSLGCEAIMNCTGLGAHALCDDELLVASRGVIALFQRPLVNSAGDVEATSAVVDGCGGGGGGGGTISARNNKYSNNAVVTVHGRPVASDSKPAYCIPRADLIVVGGTFEVQPVRERQLSDDENVKLLNIVEEQQDVLLKRLVKNYRELYVYTDPALLGATTTNGNHAEEEEAEVVEAKLLEQCKKTLLKTWTGYRPLRRCGVRVELDMQATSELGMPVVHNYGHGGSGWTIHYGSCETACDILSKFISV
jgi:hypothetical protein